MEVSIKELDAETILASVDYDGVILEIIARAAMDGETMVLSEFHILGPGRNCLGRPKLKALIADLMEKLELDELRIEGAARTSGANPGRKPAPLVFRRKHRHPRPRGVV